MGKITTKHIIHNTIHKTKPQHLMSVASKHSSNKWLTIDPVLIYLKEGIPFNWNCQYIHYENDSGRASGDGLMAKPFPIPVRIQSQNRILREALSENKSIDKRVRFVVWIVCVVIYIGIFYRAGTCPECQSGQAKKT